MTEHEKALAAPVLRMLATEIGQVRQMLLRYEENVEIRNKHNVSAIAHIQEFDLAVQSLQDMEQLVHHLDHALPSGLTISKNLGDFTLLLERSRRQYEIAIGETSQSLCPDRSDRVSMF